MNCKKAGFVFPALLLAVGLLSACGDDDDDGNGGAPPAARTVRLASLNGAQETPAVTTAAFGAGALAVDEATGAVSGFIVTSGLVSPTAAHVHLAARGTPGDVIVPLTGGPEMWVVPDDAAPLTAAQIQAFRAGNLYFNAHTTANPNGEIRGQLDKTGAVRLTAMDGAQETPAVTTGAFGAGMLSVDGATGDVAGFILTSGLVSPTAAHVHQAARGTPGSVIVPLTGGPELWVVPDGATDLTAEQRTAFTAGNLYFNAHTTANPDGVVRGQLDKAGAVRLTALNGAQETPSVTSAAFGAGALSVDGASGDVAGFIFTTGLVSPTAAHVHQAARGTPGDVRVPLTGGPDLWIVPDGATDLAAELRTAFTAGNLYFNAHTPANPNGEIRGQLD